MAPSARLTGSLRAVAIGAARRAALGAAALALAVLPVGAPSAAGAAVNEDTVAVTISNSNYTGDRIPNVDYALRDADAFKRYLIDVQGYREGNIIDLRDATQA